MFRNLQSRTGSRHLFFTALCCSFFLALEGINALEDFETNRIEIELQESDRNYLREGTSNYEFQPVKIKVNGGPAVSSEMKTRGQSCLFSPRRCFSMKLESEVSFKGNPNQAFKSKYLYLASLWQDKGYIHNRIGAGFFKKRYLFPPRFQYTEVVIDGKHQGLYMVMEKPHIVMRDRYKAEFVGRRSYYGILEEKYRAKGQPDLTSQFFEGQSRYSMSFHFFYQLLELEGEQLFRVLHRQLDTKRYMEWLALNSLMMNGDYTDEVYFYVVPPRNENQNRQRNRQTPQGRPIRFLIAAWDFDDLFKPPHRSPLNNFYYKDLLDRDLFYSVEDPIDRKIAKDSYLNERYRYTFNRVLAEKLTEQVITQEFDLIKKEISPYLDIPEVLERSKVDQGREGKPYTRQEILDLLKDREKKLKQRRKHLLKILNPEKPKKVLKEAEF